MSARLLIAAAWLSPLPVLHQDRGEGWGADRGAWRDERSRAARPGFWSTSPRGWAPGLSAASPVGQARLGWLVLALTAVLAGGAGVVQAQSVSQIPSRPARGPCVQVDVAGHRAGHLDCAAQALQAAARQAQVQARSGLDTPAPAAGSPDAMVGTASLSGARLRLGPALGHAVRPQRPGARP